MSVLGLLTIWLICVIALSLVKLKWGIALYLAYIIIVPSINLAIPGLAPGHIISLMAIISFVSLRRNNNKFDWKPFIPFIAYFLVSFIIIPFQDGIPFDIMLTHWRRDIISILFLPIIIWNVIRLDPSSVQLFRKTILICIAIAVGYGIILTRLEGVNPYIMIMLQYMDVSKDMESYYIAEGTGRLFGRISSVFHHPMMFAMFLGLAVVYLFYIRKRIGKLSFIIFISATLFMTIVCGVRSVLGGLIVAAIFFLVERRNFKLLLYVGCTICIVIGILSFFPEWSDYLGSIFDINNKKGDVRGSSVDMRITQLEGAINEASKNPFFGQGYQWTAYYLEIKGDHPVCLAFESLVFVILCNSGIIGIFLWLYLTLKYFKTVRILLLKDVFIFDALIIFYLSYSFITGEYGYMKYFLIFYVLLLGENVKNGTKLQK